MEEHLLARLSRLEVQMENIEKSLDVVQAETKANNQLCNELNKMVIELKISNENTSVTLSTTDPSLWSGRTDINVIGTGYRSLFKPRRSKFIQKACHEITSLFYSLFVYPELIKPNSKKYFCRNFHEAVKFNEQTLCRH